MPSERTVEITPSAPALIESLRGLGYSPETAIADLIDNCIAAEATSIELDLQWNEGEPVIAILDDGRGMTSDELAEAMRLGGAGPSAARSSSDLGRFGLGLKTASLSQCRRLTIVSRHAARTVALVLDVDVIARRGWVAVVPEPLPDHPLVRQLIEKDHGTVVIWDRMDEFGGLAGMDKETFFLRLQDIRAHLGMVFHRFISGDARRIRISVNERAVKAWDPFQRDHPSITELRAERIRHGGSSFTIKPYVLPHKDRFKNDAAYDAAGGPGGWTARQGFYVYRGKRLLVAGNWLGLGGTRAWTREESSRLARIEVDLSTDLDTDWRIDVRKSQARPPGSLRARLTAIAGRCREQAREVFAWRGQGPRPPGHREIRDPIWMAKSLPTGFRYTINREHPALIAFLKSSKADPELFDALLSLIEQSVPVERIWLDVSESGGAPSPTLDPEQIDRLVSQLVRLARVLPPEMPAGEQADFLLRGIPTTQPELRSSLVKKLEATV